MSKMIQVRNVPDELHRELERRARDEGKTLTAFIQEILEREMSSLSVEEALSRIRTRRPADLGRPAAELLRAEREERRS